MRFVQLPVEDDDVDAFRPQPLQLSLVLVVVVAYPTTILDSEPTAPKREVEDEDLCGSTDDVMACI